MYKGKKFILFISFLVILLILGISLIKFQEKPLKIIMLNIGQGDAIYIETPNGNNMLIDAGRDRTVMHELGDVMPINKKTIDFIEVSNPDLDHIGGFPFVMEKYKVREILSPGTKHDSLDSYKAIEKIAKEDKIPVIRPKTGDIIMIDNKSAITYKILWPEGNVSNWEVNAGSMVGLLEYSGHKILFTGDAPKEVEDQIILKYGASLKDIDILKVGHHGSKTSTGEALTMIARPKYSIISAGLNNRYGHPHEETLDMLNLVHSKILITANDGRIVCKVWIKKETVCI